MALGGVLGMLGVQIPFVETGIVISVLALGVLIAASVHLPLAVSIIVVGLFAIFHGHAHGAEMPETASGFAYAAGFIIATAFLHACGIGLGIAHSETREPGRRSFRRDCDRPLRRLLLLAEFCFGLARGEKGSAFACRRGLISER